MNAPSTVVQQELNLAALPAGQKTKVRVNVIHDASGEPVSCPILVAKGKEDGPVLGITACVHGDEINGIDVIHKLFEHVDCSVLTGSIVAVLVVNVPGFERSTRLFRDGQDLNRIMPGKKDGSSGSVFAFRFLRRVAYKFDYLLDLHTASSGRVNTLYVRANMEDPVTAKLSLLLSPRVILHSTGAWNGDSTLRNACTHKGIPSITVEIGDPDRFNRTLIEETVNGLMIVVREIGLLPEQVVGEPDVNPPVICTRSIWCHTAIGGILKMKVSLLQRLKRGEVVGTIHNIFGEKIQDCVSPVNGIVIGMAQSPIVSTGDRMIHIGLQGELEDLGLDPHDLEELDLMDAHHND